MIDDPGYATISELTDAYRARTLSPVEAVEACLARIDAVEPVVNAWVTVDRAGALEGARAATAALTSGELVGPLHGIPVGIKDLTETAGLRTTFGSTLYRDHVPTDDELVVARLRAAGAIILGKTNTPEFGTGSNTFNDVAGATRNPYDPRRTCGGSSGGSAVALATGTCTICEGSDLGGSLRTPAAFSNVVGFRTTPGLVPMWPDPSPWEGLAVTGPMARTVADVAHMLASIAGADPRVPLSYPVDGSTFIDAARHPTVRGLRVAFSPDLGGVLDVDPEISEICRSAASSFARLGATVVEDSPDLRGVREIIRATRGASMVAAHAERVERHAAVLQPGLVWNVQQGLALTSPEVAAATQLRGALWSRVAAFMQRYDLLICPTTAVLPFPVEEPYPTVVGREVMEDYTHWFRLTYALTLTTLPVLAVPAGFSRSGMPVGLQIAGRLRDEVGVLRAGAALEAETGFWRQRPPL